MNFIIPSAYRARDSKYKKGSTFPNLSYPKWGVKKNSEGKNEF